MPRILETQRLILRTWCKADLEPMHKINQDPNVMEYLLPLNNKQQTQFLIDRINQHHAQHGYSLYAVELKATHEMIGFIGLLHRTKTELDVAFNPSTEIGWRLASQHWQKGLATEGAKAVLEHAFEVLKLSEIVSFTVIDNKKSRRVMEKIGLHYQSDEDFDHPKVPDNNPLKRHVLYRITKAQYLQLRENN